MWIRSSLVFVTVVLCGCSISANYGDAKMAVDVFHHLIDADDYAAIYNNSAKGFQNAGARDLLLGFFARVNRKLGKCGVATVNFGGYQATTSGTFVTTTDSRVCDNGTLSEQFTWLMVDGKAKLLRYNADSPLLLTD